MNINRVILLCLFFAPLFCKGQDVHFSHIHATPTFLNPAMTGLFDGDIRFATNFRTQWTDVTKGYRTMAGSVDMKFLETKGNNVFGGGLQVIADKAGDLNFSTNIVNLSFSVLKALDRKGTHFVSLGFQNSFTSTSVNYSNIIANHAEPAILDGAGNNSGYWDMSFGVGWFKSFSRRTSAYLGGSMFHLNQPYSSILDDPNSGSVIYRKYVVHGGAELDIGRSMAIKPSFIFMDQGPHQEITTGTFWRYTAGKTRRSVDQSLTSIYFGGWLRWYLDREAKGMDAFVASIRLDYKNTFITFSYDINISQYNRVSFGRGGPELSLVKTLDFGDNRKKRSSKVKCPSFYY